MFPKIEILKAYGIPIRLHWTFYIFVPMYLIQQANTGNGFFLLFLALGAFSSIVLHELGHSILAIKKDCNVSEIVLTPIGGIARLMQLPKDYRDEFQVAVAGPLVSIFLAVIFFPLSIFFSVLHLGFLSGVCLVLSVLNAVWVVFNLIPAFPMDGGRIFRAWLTPRKGKLEATRIASQIGKYVAIAFILIGIAKWQLILACIGGFVWMAATAEYQAMALQKSFGGFFTDKVSAHQYEDADYSGFNVSPPPYASKVKRTHSLLLTDTLSVALILLKELKRMFQRK